MIFYNWINMYPIIGMISLTSGLLMLCSFVRSRPKTPKSKETTIKSNSTPFDTPSNLLTNEDSSKIFRGHRTLGSSSHSSSQHSTSVDTLAQAVAITVEPEESKDKVHVPKTPVPEVVTVKSNTEMDRKRSKSLVKMDKIQSDLKLKSKDSTSVISLRSSSRTTNPSILSINSVRSAISAIESEPEISTIRTIYKSKGKKPIKSIISTIDSEESDDGKW